MEKLINWDRAALHFINSDLANGMFDFLMPLLRNAYFWAPLYVFLAAWLLVNYRKAALPVLVFAVAAFALSDQLTAHLIKNIIQRPRPCNDVFLAGQIRTLVPCGTGFSFPSSHASNHFTIAFFIISMFPRKEKWIVPSMLTWAALVCFAQVYVGVHYPIDVIFGALIGSQIGLLGASLCKLLFKINLNENDPGPPGREQSNQHG